jgi:hypothetical protein
MLRWARARLDYELWRLTRNERIPFELRSRLDYWLERRTWPQRRPIAINQKIRWRMAYDRNPLFVTLSDKLEVRDYIAERVGSDLLPELYTVVEDPGTLDFAALPREFVLKPNHGCAGMWFVTDAAPAEGRLPSGVWDSGRTRPDDTDHEQVVAAARRWLASDFSNEWLEWAYTKIEPRLVFAEELLPFQDGSPPPDIKLWAFHGRVRAVRFISGRFGDTRATLFTGDWEHRDVFTEFPLADPPPPRPAQFDRMVAVAERLAEGLDFVRVDFYEVGDRLVLGELTLYPSRGRGGWDPESFQAELGSWWELPERRRRLSGGRRLFRRGGSPGASGAPPAAPRTQG